MAQATTQTGYDKRLGEIRAIWRKDSWLYGLTGLLAGFIMGIAASGALHQFMTWFWDGFWNEALSIAITVVILDRLATNREIEREAKEHKKTLIVQMRSRDNATAINAIAQLEENGWLYDGSLKNAYLRAANFCDARLRQLNKKHGQRKTIILKGVELGYADLRRAELGSVDLQGAKLEVVNFFKARLTHVDLRGANLKNANLRDAKLHFDSEDETRRPLFNEHTILPDGTQYILNDGLEQLRRFIDSDHPDFWQPKYLDSNYSGDIPTWAKKE